MAADESRPDAAGIRESPAEATPLSGIKPVRATALAEVSAASTKLPSAWQPFTFRGVAAFAHARVGRLLIAQTVVALLVAASVVWFLQHAWVPRILEAIRALPSTGAIENQILTTPRTIREPLAADNFLAISVNLEQSASFGSASDLRLEFHRTRWSVCSLLGCSQFDYPAGYQIQFNQPELEAGWGAWRLSIIAGIVGLTVIYLFVSWSLLAMLYAIPVWLAGFFKDRQISLFGAWKLSAAALLTPALGMAASIVLYGSNAVDLLRWLLLAVAHIPLGWLYVYLALRQVPTVSGGGPRPPNPFADEPTEKTAKSRPANPFAA
jgi:hypothetical protein